MNGTEEEEKVSEHTEWDMMRSMIIWEVSEEAKEKGLPETVAADSSTSPAMSSSIIDALELLL